MWLLLFWVEKCPEHSCFWRSEFTLWLLKMLDTRIKVLAACPVDLIRGGWGRKRPSQRMKWKRKTQKPHRRAGNRVTEGSSGGILGADKKRYKKTVIYLSVLQLCLYLQRSGTDWHVHTHTHSHRSNFSVCVCVWVTLLVFIKAVKLL